MELTTIFVIVLAYSILLILIFGIYNEVLKLNKRISDIWNNSKGTYNGKPIEYRNTK